MSETPEDMQDDQQAGPAEESKQSQDESETFDKDYVKKLREESAKYRTQAKANAEAAEKVTELENQLEESKKSLEKANDEISGFKALEERRQWVSQIANDKGLPVDVVERISGDTYEEISEGAEVFSKSFARGAYVPKVADAPKHKRTTAEIFADHIGSRL